jgi:hypothetical protein
LPPIASVPVEPPRVTGLAMVWLLLRVALAEPLVSPSCTAPVPLPPKALATVPLMRDLTWLFQVMPLFFIVGGYANAISWRSAGRRGESYATWLQTRLVRLVRPTAVFFAVWVGLLAAVVIGVPDAARAAALAGL